MALVVGIDKYARLSALEKAGNDARAVSAALRGMGFRVDLAVDVNRRSFNKALSDFLNKVKPGAIVYFHYSGHGISIDNDTYLIPSDMELPAPNDREFVKREAVRLSELIDSFKTAQASARIIVIDACRDNPFAARGVRSIGGTRGIALLPAPKGTLIMYSAADGQAALDRLGPNDRQPTSVYTRSLLKQLTIPGISMVEMARNVRREVEEAARSIGHDQRPAYYDELSDDLRLIPAAARPDTPQAARRPQASDPAVAGVPPVAPLPPPAAGILTGVDLRGSDYHRLAMTQADPLLCQAACRADSRCAAWTFVRPGVQGPEARCFLKAVVPGRVPDACCTSGVEKSDPEFHTPPTVSASVVGALRGIDLYGEDFRGLDTVDPGACQSACRADTRCAAWTYVRPGVHGPQARCYLKHRVPARIASPCCVSGVERDGAGAPR